MLAGGDRLDDGVVDRRVAQERIEHVRGLVDESAGRVEQQRRRVAGQVVVGVEQTQVPRQPAHDPVSQQALLGRVRRHERANLTGAERGEHEQERLAPGTVGHVAEECLPVRKPYPALQRPGARSPTSR